ncbi:hypothetical protein [Nocardioides euryhalodurans]|uniref:Uncharacterized protein n=1 Tax=Nocardioides euryhalodurans TaxID=2518370 RepID=A0A4P7GJR3_9ACTN|nr:hypothetical protein [Nocardioides euryhalodurans]QBR92278.1 hypothetical protein EXE57_08235 [Nocardioides euryhalodurans]
MNDVTTAEKVLSYGDRAVAQGKRVADAPQKKGAPKAPAPPKAPPAHVTAARSVWQNQLAGVVGGAAVTIEDLSKAPSAAIQRSSFAAWTNSGTEIYVSKSASTDANALFVVLHHEAEHIVDFRKNGNRPPVDYAAMMRFECTAYGASTTMCAGHANPDVKQYEPQMKRLRDLFCQKITAVEAATKDPNERNAAYRTFMLGKDKLLPPHKLIGDLYR